MMCVSVCEQPVSPGPVPIRREGAQVYTIGGIAFGASDSVSEVRADDFDEPCDDSANETVTVNSTARAELQAAGIDMAFHDDDDDDDEFGVLLKLLTERNRH